MSITNHGGNRYIVGQVVSPFPAITGCAATPTFTVAAISTPTASFTDAGGNTWQYITDEGNFSNVKQFGAVSNGSTNDFQAVRNALSFAGHAIGNSPDAGGTIGRTVLLPQGITLICSGSISLQVPYGVHFRGQGAWASNLRSCDSADAGTHVITLCDPEAQLSCFGTLVSDMTISASLAAASSANIALIFSNAVQQMDAVQRVAMYSGNKSCVRYDNGYGGAAYFGINNIDCTISGSNHGFVFIGVGTTILKVRDSHVGSGSATGNGIHITTSGILIVDGYHTEGLPTGIYANITGSAANGAVKATNITGGLGCTNLVLMPAGTLNNSVVVGTAFPNGCTNTVNENGVLTTGVIVPNTTF